MHNTFGFCIFVQGDGEIFTLSLDIRGDLKSIVHFY